MSNGCKRRRSSRRDSTGSEPAQRPHRGVDNIFFIKIRAGLEGALEWLDAQLDAALALMPREGDLSLFETGLFCLLEHLPFRGTVATDPYPNLVRFARQFALRPSAERTAYRFD